MELKHFSESEVKLDQHDAFGILRFFWLEPGVEPSQLTVQDRAFAQALLVEAIDSSYHMSFVELLFKNFYGKVPSSFESVRDMVKSFAKEASKRWFEHATGKDLDDPKIYESVRATLSRNFRSTWQIRVQTGELIY